jgi:hypothetical protein
MFDCLRSNAARRMNKRKPENDVEIFRNWGIHRWGDEDGNKAKLKDSYIFSLRFSQAHLTASWCLNNIEKPLA